MNQPITLRIEELQVDRGTKPVLSNLTYAFAPGLTYLLGPNGSGKSTLLHTLMGWIPHRGLVEIDRKLRRKHNNREFVHTISMVAQQESPQFPLTIKEYVLLGRFLYTDWLGNYHKQDQDKAEEVLDYLGISSLQNRSIRSLSGGEWQKVRIAQALVQDTPILLFDEPTQALDPKNRQEIHELMQQLAVQGKTILCATHDLDPLRTAAHAYVALKGGRIMAHGKDQIDLPSFMEKVYG